MECFGLLFYRGQCSIDAVAALSACCKFQRDLMAKKKKKRVEEGFILGRFESRFNLVVERFPCPQNVSL